MAHSLKVLGESLTLYEKKIRWRREMTFLAQVFINFYFKDVKTLRITTEKNCRHAAQVCSSQ